MTIEPFSRDNIALFLKLAAAENWIAEQWEFDFLLSRFPSGCFMARGSDGETIGFVTSIKHGNSGWIGNLVVTECARGRGIGAALFKKAHEALQLAGVQTVWLTASAAGKSLYEKEGFSSIDTIVRWVGSGNLNRQTKNNGISSTVPSCTLMDCVDFEVWGDRRAALLEATAERGRLITEAEGCAVIQPCGTSLQLGPFTARDSTSAEQVLDTALRSIPAVTRIFLDSPASNRSGLRLFNRKKLRISGTNELMYAGRRPAYRPEMLYGLATMGSCG